MSQHDHDPAFGDLLERATRDLPVPLADFEATARSRGRALRNRRRASIGGGLALAVVGTVSLTQLLPGQPGGTGIDPAGSQSEPPPVIEPVGADWWEMSASQMYERLQAELPAGLTVTDADITIAYADAAGDADGGPSELTGWGAGGLDADGERVGAFNVILSPPSASSTQQEPPAPEPRPGSARDESGMVQQATDRFGCPGDGTTPAEAGFDTVPETCETLVDEAEQPIGRVWSEVKGGVWTYSAEVRHDGSGTVRLDVSNSTGRGEKWTPGSETGGELPPITLTETQRIVESDVWTR